MRTNTCISTIRQPSYPAGWWSAIDDRTLGRTLWAYPEEFRAVRWRLWTLGVGLFSGDTLVRYT